MKNFLHILLARRSVPVRFVAEIVLEAAKEGEEEPEAKWVQIAREGEFLGHRGGQAPFKFTRKTFEDVRKNIRANPSFKAGEDGVGIGDVIPWDFDHASERDPASGTAALLGVPAQGWTRDVEVRTNAEGKAEMWALTRFLEPAKTFVKNGQYKWASVALVFDSIHQVTAQHTGPMLTSIALTNKPFIEGMAELAASKHYFCAAQDVERAAEMMKQLFNLPAMATPSQIEGELLKLKSWTASDAIPAGVDFDDIISDLRTILNLPTLTSVEEVLRDAEKSVQALNTQPAQTAPTSAPATMTTKERSMKILTLLATLFGVREAEETVEAYARDLVKLRADLVKSLKLDRDNIDGILDAVKLSQTNATHLVELVSAVGAKDVPTAITAISELMTAKTELAKVQPELIELRKSKAESEETEIKLDVDRALAAKGFGEDMRGILTLSRRTNRDEFLKAFPADATPAAKPPAAAAHLTQSVAATPGGTQLKVGPGGQIMRSTAPSAPAAATGTLDGKAVNLSAYSGANDSQRMIACLTATRPGFDKLKWEDQCEAAFLALEQLKGQAA